MHSQCFGCYARCHSTLGARAYFSTSLNFYAFNVHVRETAVTYIRRAYYACAALRANVAGRMGNRISPAESALINFSAGIGSASLDT